ncbi:MAG: type III pantothenate kinase [Candidatus Omnitrophica bacterium]|nr:type III pantothenate kinase [Candidatus Omnitrophota bacterium]
MNMLLAIDVGNTTVNFGIFKSGRLVSSKKILTIKAARLRKLPFPPVNDIIISSVVPDVTKILKKTIKSNFKARPVILGEDLIVPIKNLYNKPRQVGQDRLVNAYAAYKKFGGNSIIVDFGTAVTFDCVSKKGEYLGGLIFPGLEISLNALSAKAALLPRITLERPRALIGKNTVTSMRSGIIHGYAELCNGLIRRLKKEMKGACRVILTGGHAGLLSKYCHFDSLQPNLTLEGLYLLWNYFNKIK